eukprot:Pgem_evm1s8730
MDHQHSSKVPLEEDGTNTSRSITPEEAYPNPAPQAVPQAQVQPPIDQAMFQQFMQFQAQQQYAPQQQAPPMEQQQQPWQQPVPRYHDQQQPLPQQALQQQTLEQQPQQPWQQQAPGQPSQQPWQQQAPEQQPQQPWQQQAPQQQQQNLHGQQQPLPQQALQQQTPEQQPQQPWQQQAPVQPPQQPWQQQAPEQQPQQPWQQQAPQQQQQHLQPQPTMKKTAELGTETVSTTNKKTIKKGPFGKLPYVKKRILKNICRVLIAINCLLIITVMAIPQWFSVEDDNGQTINFGLAYFTYEYFGSTMPISYGSGALGVQYGCAVVLSFAFLFYCISGCIDCCTCCCTTNGNIIMAALTFILLLINVILAFKFGGLIEEALGMTFGQHVSNTVYNSYRGSANNIVQDTQMAYFSMIFNNIVSNSIDPDNISTGAGAILSVMMVMVSGVEFLCCLYSVLSTKEKSTSTTVTTTSSLV